MRISCLVFLLGLGLACSTRSLGQPAVPSTQPALVISVSPHGDLAVSSDAKTLASGHFTCLGADWHGVEPDQVAIGALVDSSGTQDSPTHAIVRDTYTNAKSTTEIQLDGEDLRIRVHLQNLDPAKSLKNLDLHGPTFHFARNASGTLPAWHPSYIAHEDLKIYHPGLDQPLGEVFACDDSFGIGVYSTSEFEHMSLINADWVKDGIIPAECSVNLFTRLVAPPGQSVEVEENFRISGDCSIPHLFEPYKKLYTAHFPKLLYHPDPRPVGQFAAVGGNLVKPGNPLGFGGPVRRLDSYAGTGAYIRAFAPPLKEAGALGMIFWSPGGFKPPMYPPDFDLFPHSVQDNIPMLVAGFRKYGLRVGLCARCGEGVTRESGKDPQVYRLDAHNSEQMKTLMGRFDHAMEMGFDLFYLDSFGTNNPDDQLILKMIRDKVGPDVQLYTEFCTDMSLPYAGHYCEWRGQDILWTSFDKYHALRYLCPDSVWLCISRTSQPVPAQFAKLDLIPLVEDSAEPWLPASRPVK